MEGAIVKIKKKDKETDEEAIARVKPNYPEGTVFEVESSSVPPLSAGALADAQSVDPRTVTDLPLIAPAEVEVESEPVISAPPSRGGFTLYKWNAEYSGSRKDLPTTVLFEEIGFDSTLKYKTDGSWRLGSFSNKAEYLERIDELAARLIIKYRGQIVDPETENYADLVRSPTSLGFTHRVLNDMNEDNYLQYREFFGMREDDGVKHARSKINRVDRDGNRLTNEADFSFYGLDVERTLNRFYVEAEKFDYVKPSLMHEFYKRFLNRPDYHIDPLPLDYDDRFYRMYAPLFGSVYNDAMQHLPYKITIVEHVQAMVKSLVNVEIANYSSDFSSLLRSLDVNVTQINNIGSISRGLKPDDAISMINAIITCQVIGTHARLDFNFVGSSYNFDISTLIHCVVAKLVIPRHMIDVASERQIDNYIFLWLFQPFVNQGANRGQNEDQRRLSAATAVSLANNDENMLELFFGGQLDNVDQSAAVKAYMLQMKQFMYTDGMGNGWNAPFDGNDKLQSVEVPEELKRVSAGGYKWLPYNTVAINNPSFINSATNQPTQYLRFVSFVTAVSGLFNTAGRKSKLLLTPKEQQAFVAVMTRVQGSFNTIMLMGNEVNKITQQMVYLPIARPGTHEDININLVGDSRVRIPVKLGAPMSMTLLSPVIKTVSITAEHFESAQVLCYAVEVLREVYLDTIDRFRDFKYEYTQSKLNKIVESRVSKHPALSGFFGLFKPQLSDLLLNDQIFQRDRHPAVVTHITMMQRTREVLKDASVDWLTGVTRLWYFCPNPLENYMAPVPRGRSNPEYREYNYFISTGVPNNQVVKTYNSYEELYDDVREERVAGLFQQCLRGAGKAIRFKFPIVLNHANEVPGNSLGYASLPSAIELQLQRGVSATSILRALEARYTLYSDRRRVSHNSQVMLATPLFWTTITNRPHFDVTSGDFEHNFTHFQHRVRVLYEQNDVTHASFFNFSRRLDI
jgi:hypothetical protein